MRTYKFFTGGSVGVTEILAQIDEEIAQLQHARALLAGKATRSTKKAAAVPVALKAAKKKRNLSPEGRKRIAEAVKRRWAEKKKSPSSN
jgi:alpha-beta hydrolase superfamily lysophospholipase